MLRFVLALAFLLAIPAGAALADGFIIIPEPPLPPIDRTSYFPLSVKFHRVTVTIEDQVATTEVDQSFYNPNNVDLEGMYLFPLPTDAAISKFSMYMDGKEVEGELLDRDKARGIYEGIVRRMKDPALLEYVDRGAFKARVFPIPARGEKRVRLSYQQVVPAEGGLAEYRYPLNTEKFSLRPLEDVTVTATIKSSSGPVGNIFSPSHPVEIVRLEGGGARVSFEAKNVTPDRDFVCFFDRADKDKAVGLSVVTHKPVGTSEDGYFLMLLAPRHEAGAAVMPKDVVFIMDTSGSMAGEKMEQARGALRYCLSSLDARDRFAVIDFATEVRSFREKLEPAAKETVAAAIEYVNAMKARGGTDIHGALTRALALEGAEDRPFLVVFVTDGQPTIGVTVPDEIERAVKAARENRPKKGAGARIFVFGVGTDLNASLLDRIAEQNQGTREYVGPGESIEIKVSRFFDKVASPVLSGVSLEVLGLETHDIYPKPLPDLFRGGELAIVGRYKGEGPKAIKVRGTFGDKSVELVFEATFGKDPKAPFLPRVFAVRKVGFLLDQIRLHGEKEELKQEVVRLAKEFGIITPYTSYLVVEDEKEIAGRVGRDWRESAPADALARLGRALDRDGDDYARAEEEARRALAGKAGSGTGAADAPASAQLAAGEAAKQLGGQGGATSPPPAAPEPGAELKGYFGERGRFAEGEKDKKAWDDLAEQAEREAGALIKIVEDRTFYRHGDTWVDGALKLDSGLEVTRVVYLSDAYFKLASDRPAVARFLALGPRVKLVEGGRIYEVVIE